MIYYLQETLIEMVLRWTLRFTFLALVLIDINVTCYSNDFKIAFLFLTRGPMPMEPIWDAFFKWKTSPDQYSIFVHPHHEYTYTNDSIFYGREVRTGLALKWGGITLVQATQALVAKALEDKQNKWFALMSEACIPLHPMTMWRKALAENDLSIVNACPHSDNITISEMSTEVDARWHSELKDVGFKRSEWRKSAQWFMLNRKHAEIFASSSDLLKGFANVECADEHALATILSHFGQDNATSCSDGFIHHEFTKGGSHPTLYGHKHINRDLFLRLDSAHGTWGFSTKCSGRSTMCRFTARKFPREAIFHLVKVLPQLLNDTVNHIPFNGPNPIFKRLRVDLESNHYFLLLHKELLRVPVEEMGHELGLYADSGIQNSGVDRESNTSLLELTMSQTHVLNKDKVLKSVLPLTPHERSVFKHVPSPFPIFKVGELCRSKFAAPIYLISKSFSRHLVTNFNVFVALGADTSEVTVRLPHEVSFPVDGERITMDNVEHWKQCRAVHFQNESCK